jgi:hypothetical protein
MRCFPPRCPVDFIGLAVIGAALIFLIVIGVDIVVLSSPDTTNSAEPATPTPITKPGAMADAAFTPTPTSTPRVGATTSPTSHAQKASPASTPTPQPSPIVASAQPSPSPQPTQPPSPSPAPYCPNAVNNNPWCYSFTPGVVITNPNAAFCDGQYFTCVSDFWTANRGYVVECGNGKYSHSGGISGACSRDGSVAATLYQP